MGVMGGKWFRVVVWWRYICFTIGNLGFVIFLNFIFISISEMVKNCFKRGKVNGRRYLIRIMMLLLKIDEDF